MNLCSPRRNAFCKLAVHLSASAKVHALPCVQVPQGHKPLDYMTMCTDAGNTVLSFLLILNSSRCIRGHAEGAL
eukprot:1007367-Pelagomonas_calceolata.AAC.1